ncbi:flagellar filament capping protein FliD [Undibacterium cyanobacteriorum]|uniref:Flagellar hook-associated protein 2 n=1 Tax=Undibacterium cyanobacteriorum TaxID=3073561 RepID=A0ABY9RND1_9BURK|nr:flagellar filament capping protein FliD [Undibacterium sp. 20NA77.5]WMW82224.1 flagellar filament capping protein FliD [Undibacterium sp. 20NA77.5]
MGIQSTGIGSNLDVNGLITKLMQVESQPLTTLAKKEASYQAKLTAYGTLTSALSSFQSSLPGLYNLASFQNLNASSSDSTILTATTTSSAIPGTYNINVTKLAQSQSISSAGQAATNTPIGSGAATTISIQFGTISGGTSSAGVYTGATFTQDANQALAEISIDSTNNTLQGIRDAINAAGKGVTASIVGDGSATVPYHLVLSSTKTGVTSSLKISVSGDASIASLLNYDPSGTQNLTEVTTGQNAALTANGIAVTSASNAVTGVIQGTTINLAKTGSSTLSLSNNIAGVQNSVNGFVKAYNDLQTSLKALTGYDAAAKKGSILQGDTGALGVQNQIRNVLNSAVNGLGGGLTTLSSIGISVQKDGTMALDSAKLSAALNNNFSEVAGLFATAGKTTDSLVSFAGSTSNTTQGSYAINVTTLATQGSLTGDLDLTAGTTTIAAGTKIKFTIDSTMASVSLTEGTYSASQLASMIQSAVNGNSTFSAAGLKISASINGSGFLKLSSDSYGSTSNVILANDTGTTISSLTGSVSSGTSGLNVAGTINGLTASGSGQTLSGAVGTVTEGLKLTVNGGTIGARGVINFSRGFASQLNDLLSSANGSTGALASSKDAINRNLKEIDKQKTILNNRLFDVEARYRAQFTALDKTISNLNTTSSFLTQQLSALTQSK